MLLYHLVWVWLLKACKWGNCLFTMQVFLCLDLCIAFFFYLAMLFHGVYCRQRCGNGSLLMLTLILMFFILPLGQKMELEIRSQELERTLDREREVWQHKLYEKEQELLDMRSQMNSKLEDYENLLDVKLALDMEINAYRKMLEVEEQRYSCVHYTLTFYCLNSKMKIYHGPLAYVVWLPF